MILKALRTGLGNIFIFLDFITRPGRIVRSPEAQTAVDAAASALTLYQFHACPFCVKTRRVLHKLNVPVTVRDARNNQLDRQTLYQQGGRIQVPCLRIDENGRSTWLYDSKAISAYLHKRFANAA